MNDYIYADNAATTKLDIDAFEAMKPFLLEDYGNASQPYFFAKKPKMALKKARKEIADCIGAEPEEIFFTSGGTESDNWVIRKFGFATDIRHVITSNIEHHAVLNTCEQESLNGRCDVQYLSVDNWGCINPADLRSVLSEEKETYASSETTLVSLMFANNEIGTIEPIKELCDISHEYGEMFHTDAVQAMGHVIIDVKALGVDFLSASAHKFNGPKGIGFLYHKGGLLDQYHTGGAQEMGMRAGTEDVASIVGMAVALRKNVDAVVANSEHLKRLESILITDLRNAGLDFIRNWTNQLPGNVNLSFADASGEMLLHRLDLKKIFISTGSACDGKETQVSHVIKAIGVPEKYADGTIRISLGKDNTEDDVQRIAREIISILHH